MRQRIPFSRPPSRPVDPAAVRRLREFRGMSIRQLADESGVSKSHISFIEHGKRRAHEAVMSRLAKALGVPMEDLMVNG